MGPTHITALIAAPTQPLCCTNIHLWTCRTTSSTNYFNGGSVRFCRCRLSRNERTRLKRRKSECQTVSDFLNFPCLSIYRVVFFLSLRKIISKSCMTKRTLDHKVWGSFCSVTIDSEGGSLCPHFINPPPPPLIPRKSLIL